jgi:ketosteroid isomerase-like protein
MLGAWLVKRKTLAAFDALNRHDLEAVARNYAEEVVFVYPGNVGPHGVHKSKRAVRALLTRIFNQFPYINFKVKRLAVTNGFDVVGNNVVYTHWDVELRNHEGTSARFSGVTVATIRRGKVVLIEDIFDASDESHRRSWAASIA